MTMRFVLATLAASLFTGCTVGPNYRRPAVTTPDVFRGSTETTPPADLTSLADLKWFEVFKDDRLQDMIRTALVQNYDLREAVARVDAARANLGITRADQFPTIDGQRRRDHPCASPRLAHSPFLRASRSNGHSAAWLSTSSPSKSISGAGCAGRPKRRGLTCSPARTIARR